MRRRLLFILCLTAGWAATAHAGDEIKLTVGNARVVTIRNAERVAIGNPDIADLKRIQDNELLITGKSLGSTTLIVWQTGGRKDISTITVTTGKAAQTMIQVDVQVMEISKTNDMDVGLDWESILGKDGQLSLRETTAPLNAIGTLARGQLDLQLKLLVEKGHGKVLARPKLLTLSGHNASFSSGGELPVSTVSTNGAVSVDWKKYGVNLDVLATATSSGAVSMDIRAEVSDADFTRLVQGNPAIKTRWAKTSIQVEPDVTVVIGGLIQNKETINHQGVPVLSEIPVLGYLFKSTVVMSEESELVIFVTPHIVGG